MASSCNIDDGDTDFSKKRKTSANEEMCESKKEVKAVDLRDCKKYSVNVKYQFGRAYSSAEDRKAAFLSLLKEAGCSETQMCGHRKYCFDAYITEEQAEKLAGVKNVDGVGPTIPYYIVNRPPAYSC